MSERMAGVEAPFYRERGGFVCNLRELRGVIPKPRAFTSGARDLAQISCEARFVDIAPALRQVTPIWIHRLDEFYFLAASPAFDLFFTIDRSVGVEEALVVSQLSQVVATGKAFDDFIIVLPDSSRQVARDPRLQNMRALPICHDVNME